MNVAPSPNGVERRLTDEQWRGLQDIFGHASDLAERALDGAAERAQLDASLRGIGEEFRQLKAAVDAGTPLFDAAGVRFGRFVLSDPPPREWLLVDVLPASVVGVLASMGGAGKSFLVYQALFSIVTGLPFLGIPVGTSGGALYLAAEDDEPELHRRGLALLDWYSRLTTWRPEYKELLAERLHVVSRVAEHNLLTAATGDSQVRQTPLVGRLIDAASAIPDLRLIVVDPVSRFRGGRANDEEHATRFVEALEAIRRGTEAAVLALHHVSQSGIKDGGGQEIVRGSTALVDGVRWVATLQRLRRDAAPDYGLHESEADRYLRLEVPKSNYAAPFPGLWLRRDTGGVLVPVPLAATRTTKQGRKGDAEYLGIIARLQKLLRDEGPLTRNQIRESGFATVAGPLGAGDKTVRGVIERAVRDGSLYQDKDCRLQPPEVEP